MPKQSADTKEIASLKSARNDSYKLILQREPENKIIRFRALQRQEVLAAGQIP